MDRLGRGYFDKDEPGAAIARACANAQRTRRGEPPPARRGLRSGTAGLPDDAPPCATTWPCSNTPDWVDWDKIERPEGVPEVRPERADILLQLSLIGGYRFGGPRLLVATGGLTGNTTCAGSARPATGPCHSRSPTGCAPAARRGD